MSKDTKATFPFLSFSHSHPPTCYSLFSMLHIVKELCPEKKKHIGYFKESIYCLYNLTHNFTPYLRTVKERSDLYFLLDATAKTALISLQYMTPLVRDFLAHCLPEEVQTFLASISFLLSFLDFFIYFPSSNHPLLLYQIMPFPGFVFLFRFVLPRTFLEPFYSSVNCFSNHFLNSLGQISLHS